MWGVDIWEEMERLWGGNGRQTTWFERFWDMAPGGVRGASAYAVCVGMGIY